MAERGLTTRALNSKSSSLPTMPYTSPGLIFGSSSMPSSSLCFCFTFGCLVSLGHHWPGFSRRGNWKVGVMLWALAWTDQSSPSPAPPFVARETLRAWQEKNHPWLELSDVHRETTENIRVTVIPFYMGMRVRAQRGLLPSGLGPRFCGIPSVTAGAGSTCQPCAGGSASKPSLYGAGLSSLLAMADTRT